MPSPLFAAPGQPCRLTPLWLCRSFLWMETGYFTTEVILRKGSEWVLSVSRVFSTQKSPDCHPPLYTHLPPTVPYAGPSPVMVKKHRTELRLAPFVPVHARVVWPEEGYNHTSKQDMKEVSAILACSGDRGLARNPRPGARGWTPVLGQQTTPGCVFPATAIQAPDCSTLGARCRGLRTAPDGRG